MKRIIALPITYLPVMSSETLYSEMLDHESYEAKELVVPSWLVGSMVYVQEFMVGENAIVPFGQTVTLEAFRKYRFGPRVMNRGQQIKLVLQNMMGMGIEVALSVKGKML